MNGLTAHDNDSSTSISPKVNLRSNLIQVHEEDLGEPFFHMEDMGEAAPNLDELISDRSNSSLDLDDLDFSTFRESVSPFTEQLRDPMLQNCPTPEPHTIEHCRIEWAKHHPISSNEILSQLLFYENLKGLNSFKLAHLKSELEVRNVAWCLVHGEITRREWNQHPLCFPIPSFTPTHDRSVVEQIMDHTQKQIRLIFQNERASTTRLLPDNWQQNAHTSYHQLYTNPNNS